MLSDMIFKVVLRESLIYTVLAALLRCYITNEISFIVRLG